MLSLCNAVNMLTFVASLFVAVHNDGDSDDYGDHREGNVVLDNEGLVFV